ncbi:MAG: hypothetical protein Q9222_004516 [Ikaeria aurantiellina]
MRFNRAILLIGLGVGHTIATSDSACALPTVTVTVSAPPVTKTIINAADPSTPVPTFSVPSADAFDPIPTSTAAITTIESTSFLTSTKVVHLDPSTPLGALQSNVVSDGYYYFADDNGTTSWISDKTPNSGALLVTSTVLVTLQPQPTSAETTEVVDSSEISPTWGYESTTSFTTISSTSFSTHYLTKPLAPLESTSVPLPTAKWSPYAGYSGWNVTLTTFRTLQSNTTSVTPLGTPALGQTGWVVSGSTPVVSQIVSKTRQVRQLGATVTATIDGIVVTWINSYGGKPSPAGYTTSTEASSSTSAVSTSWVSTPPEYTWEPDPVPWTSAAAPAETSSSATSSLPESSDATPILLSSIAGTSPEPSVAFSNSEPSLTASPTTVNLAASSTLTLTPTYPNTTVSNHVSSPSPSSCGTDTGRFTVNFDDLPHFSASSNNTDIPPIFNPYRKLFWNGGYGYVPPPSDPYAPISPPQLAVYNYNIDSQATIDAGLEFHGELGAGPRANESAYWIDAYSTWIGCANSGPSECRLDFIGYDNYNTQIASQTLLQAPCPELANCKLAQVIFTDQFRDLAGLQILAYVNKTPATFYMDDLKLGWSNNTCAAQLKRSSAQ